MTDGNKIYRENQNLIKQQARHYARRYNLPFEDVEGEANEIFCKCLLSYDAERGVKFSTYLHSKLQSLNYYCKHLETEWQNIELFQDTLPTRPEIDRVIFQEAIEELSPPAKELVSSLIAGDTVISKKRKVKISTNFIRRELRCSNRKAERVFTEISGWWKAIDCYI